MHHDEVRTIETRKMTNPSVRESKGERRVTVLGTLKNDKRSMGHYSLSS